MTQLLNYKLKGKAFFPVTEKAFNYSDGDDIEEYIYDVVKVASDLATGSEELFLAIKDWPSLYHLSPTRANILRPLADKLKGKKVLEIGAGCGAITRFLGELGCIVVAVEGSARRASITAERCRDLKNVTVVCDSFQSFVWDDKFDFITLIGVLEYSNLYFEADNAPLAMLSKVKQMLTESGENIIAIENKLGLKYWLGAPEDHVGKEYFGLENKYRKDTAVTFGRLEIIDLLKLAGFKKNNFYYPFPDYKFPDTVITEQGLRDKSFSVKDLLLEKYEYHQAKTYDTRFSSSLVGEALEKNQLLSEFSNSFLICSSNNVDVVNTDVLAYSYSTSRKREFCKENNYRLNTVNDIEVVRKKLYNSFSTANNIEHRLFDEKFLFGELLFKEAINITSNDKWNYDDLKKWSDKYYHILIEQSFQVEGRPYLDRAYFDLTPFNIIIQDNGVAAFFDLEWYYHENIPLFYVFFRGIYNSLLRIFSFRDSNDQVPDDVLGLTLALLKNSIDLTEVEFNRCLSWEKCFIETVTYSTPSSIGNRLIPYIKNTSNTKRESVDFLLPLHDLDIQLFWKNSGESFSEQDSFRYYINLAKQDDKTLIALKDIKGAVSSLRVDLGEKRGAFYLSKLKLRSCSEKILFCLDSDKKFHFLANNLLLLKSSIYTNKFLVLALSDDPSIEFDVPDIQSCHDLLIDINVSEISQEYINKEFEEINYRKSIEGAVVSFLDKQSHYVEDAFDLVMQRVENLLENKVSFLSDSIKESGINSQQMEEMVKQVIQKEDTLRNIVKEKALERENTRIQLEVLNQTIEKLLQQIDSKEDKLMKLGELNISLKQQLEILSSKYSKNTLWGVVKEKLKDN
ncbi:methyltransferase domain-containing protein [Pontibacter diazotrophicus]|uniref:Methyltransferase domain-containing protein n=1 Tax=Pontibacter diazotrophicus TaxID=1400979 RepID=A0A3D8LGA4_9BACT|nr:class I SAM-dependent methyltransferase [Pontibacter diazotrophicus]RDV16440.1 methyltransferase domain-containing protein [Pontibacter diazotrophicus]